MSSCSSTTLPSGSRAYVVRTHVVYCRAGNVTVTPFKEQQAPIHLVVARSPDGGETWEQVQVDDDVHPASSLDEATPQYKEMIPAIASDPARPGRVAAAWPEAVGSYSSRIVLRHSSDGGRTWSRRIDVGDTHPARPIPAGPFEARVTAVTSRGRRIVRRVRLNGCSTSR